MQAVSCSEPNKMDQRVWMRLEGEDNRLPSLADLERSDALDPQELSTKMCDLKWASRGGRPTMNGAENESDNSISRRIELKRHGPQILRILDKHGLRTPRLFGSVLHGTSRAGRDLDILVDPDDHATLLDLAKAHQELEDELGVSVDLVTPLDLPSGFRDEVVVESQPL
jgi:predicted nucleotidyltransferase